MSLSKNDLRILEELEATFVAIIEEGGTVKRGLLAVFMATKNEVLPSRIGKRFIEAACQHYRCRAEDLLDPRHHDCFTRRRYAAMVAMRRSGIGLSDIATALHYRDHMVVSHGLAKAKIRADIQRDGDAIWEIAEGKQEAARAA